MLLWRGLVGWAAVESCLTQRFYDLDCGILNRWLVYLGAIAGVKGSEGLSGVWNEFKIVEVDMSMRVTVSKDIPLQCLHWELAELSMHGEASD